MNNLQWQENLALIEDLLWQEKDAHNLASIGGCIVSNEQTIWSAYSGYARCEDQYLAEPSSIYRLGSISKVFIAHMLMHLRDADFIDINQPVQHVLPTFSCLPADTPITFHHLITHTSGLPPMPPIADMMETLIFPDAAQLLDSLNETELLFPPGSAFSYSNFGAALLAHALEHVAGLSRAGYIKNYLLQPLGMNHTGYCRDGKAVRGKRAYNR